MTEGWSTIFRGRLTEWLELRPLSTPRGEILRGLEDAEFGHPGGSHGLLHCWVYCRASSPLKMLFAFYKNFSQNDLICKVMPSGGAVGPGAGATIQFNGDSCVKATGSGAFGLYHSGRVTVGHAISRERLINAFDEIALGTHQGFGRLDPQRGWPLYLGNSADLAALVDRWFDYAYLVEQAKRHLRGESLLVRLT